MSDYFLAPRRNAGQNPVHVGEESFIDPIKGNAAFVMTGGKHGQRSADMLKGVVLIDRDGKKTGMSNPNGILGSHSCPHGQNPMACLPCYHAKGTAPKPQVPQHQRPQPAVNPIIAAVKQRAGTAELVPGVPRVQAPVHIGQNPDGTPVARKTKIVGKMPVPVIAGTVSPGETRQNTLTPFDYSQNQGRTDSKGVWHAPKHRSLIDSKPSHPNAKDGIVLR